MSLEIVFGWHLDGGSCPETAGAGESSLGNLIVGPAGLTDQLAMRLGLDREPVSHVVRTGRYMAALAACDDGKQFYSKSFCVDPWSTAISLLAMRDQLIWAGWDGSAFGDDTLRLRAFGEIERCCSINSPAELFRDVLFSLRSRSAKLPITYIKVVTPSRLLPMSWQELLLQLAATGVRIDDSAEHSTLDTSSDLGKIQQFLLTRTPSRLIGDGTFCLLESDDEYQLSEATALWLLNNGDNNKGTVIVRDNSTSILDEYCHRFGVPKPGRYARSRWRSHLQLLPLAFENRWLPAHPLRLLEFLSMPQSPVNQMAARHFKWALHKEPGFGGQQWSDAWTKAEAELRERAAGNSERDIDEKQINSSLRRMRFWLEPVRYLPAEGIPASEAVDVCNALSKWATSRMQREANMDANLIELVALVEDTRQAIIATGLPRLHKILLDRIMDAAIGEGTPLAHRYAESAQWSLVDEPGQVWADVETILWWGFTAKGASASLFNPWMQVERAALAKSQIQLERPESDIVRGAHAWRQAILNAKKSVLLARPRVHLGKAVAVHPLWHEIEELVNSQPDAIVTQAHEVLAQPGGTIGSCRIVLNEIERKPLPGARRIWSIAENTIAEPAQQSFTSLHQLIGCPMAWVLEYHAQVRPSTLMVLPDGDQLIGDIAHSVFMQLFRPGISIPADIDEAAGKLFDQCVDAIGLPLLLPGRKVEFDTARRLISLAAVDFGRHIRENEVEVDGCEVAREAPFGGGKFVGHLDVLVKDKKGRSFVVDYKWAKRMHYRLEEMQSGRQLQLASYAWLQSMQEGAFPEAGYFMIRQRRLLATSLEPFVDAQNIDSRSLETIWRAAEATYGERMDLLRRGTICATGVAPDQAENVIPEPEQQLVDPPCRFCKFGTICGVKEFAGA